MAYVSGMDASILFNGDSSNSGPVDIITIEYTSSQNKLPIFGYKSFEWDHVLKGEEVVQGTFGLNFTGAMQLNQYLTNDEVPSSYRKLPLNRSTQIGTDLYRSDFVGKDIRQTKSNNITKQMFDIEIHYQVTKSILLPNYTTTNMQGEVKTYTPVFYDKGIILKDVMINSIQQAIAADASPIGEFYTFIGKSVIEIEEPPYAIKDNKKYLINEDGALYNNIGTNTNYEDVV